MSVCVCVSQIVCTARTPLEMAISSGKIRRTFWTRSHSSQNFIQLWHHGETVAGWKKVASGPHLAVKHSLLAESTLDLDVLFFDFPSNQPHLFVSCKAAAISHASLMRQWDQSCRFRAFQGQVAATGEDGWQYLWEAKSSGNLQGNRYLQKI